MSKEKVDLFTKLYWFKNLVNMLWWKFIFQSGYKRSKKPIPTGLYCYEPDIEKNRNKKDYNIYYTKPCKYYKTLGKGNNGCSYLGIITDDMIFDDQCKMCGENEGEDEYY